MFIEEGNRVDKLVSVIIPVYNAKQYLVECLNSVSKQSYKNIEVILIDDGSKDESGKICDDFAVRDVRFTVLHKKNEGVSAARNKGLEIATGEYIYFSDSDDILEETLIDDLVKIIEFTQTDIALCSYYVLRGTEKIMFEEDSAEPKIVNQKELGEIILSNRKYAGYLWNKLFRRDFLQELKFKCEMKICEDEVFCIDYIKQIKSGVILDKPLYCYRDNPSGAMRQGLNENMLSNVLSWAYTLDFMIQNKYRDDLVKKIYYDLIFLYCSYYWHILFSSFNNKKYWLNIMKNGYKKYYGMYEPYKQWSFKQRLILFATKIRFIL